MWLSLVSSKLGQQHDFQSNAHFREVTDCFMWLVLHPIGATHTTLQTVHSAGAAPNESGTESSRYNLASHGSSSPATLSNTSSKQINSFTASSTLKLVVQSSAASHPKVGGENDDDISEAQQAHDGSFSF